MTQKEWQITGTRISSKSCADVYFGDRTVRIPGEVMVSYFLADPYEMFWLEKEDREIWPWHLLEKKQQNKLSEEDRKAVMENRQCFLPAQKGTDHLSDQGNRRAVFGTCRYDKESANIQAKGSCHA